jgi:hypothetical protein
VTWQEILTRLREPWGGVTLNQQRQLVEPTDGYAVTVNPGRPILLPMWTSTAQLAISWSLARMAWPDGMIGIFHDDDRDDIEIDPIVIVATRTEVDRLALDFPAVREGGAYEFATGNGYFPSYQGI